MGKKLVGISKASLEDVIFVSFNYRSVAFTLRLCRTTCLHQTAGFQVIYSSSDMCDGSDKHSIAYGFLGGAEVKAAGVGNVGLRDRTFPYR